MTDHPPELVIVGRVRRAHGIRGELAVELFTDEPDAIFAAGRRVFTGTVDGEPSPNGSELRVLRASHFMGGLIVAFEGINDRNAAELWRGRYFLVPVDELTPPAEGEVYMHHLLGMDVVLPDGAKVGTVAATFDLPQGLMLEVDRSADDKVSVLVPFDDRTVVGMDVPSRVIRIDPLPGLLD
jgi:16S rRNA processing protein RimM